MNRTDMEDHYLFIRMWCPPKETGEPKDPRFVCMIDTEEGPIQWTLTREFEKAKLFKSENIARRVIRAVDRLRCRVESGWYYEIVKVSEEVVDHNLPPLEEEEAA